MPSSDSRPRPATIMVALAAVCLLLAGCGDRGPRRFRASGSVTFAGKPVRLGRIVFDPDVAAGNSGPQGFAAIENGRYDTAGKTWKGFTGGPTVVRIDGLEIIDTADGAAAGRPLFPTYEVKIDLPRTAFTRDFVVPAPATAGR